MEQGVFHTPGTTAANPMKLYNERFRKSNAVLDSGTVADLHEKVRGPFSSASLNS